MKYNGYVYILGNPSINDHIKIGYTERQIQKRIKELSSTTGVPSEFELIGYFLASKGMKSEKLVHKALKKYRTNTNREFFKISPSNALEIIQELFELEPEFINEERLTYYESKFKLQKPVEEVENDNTQSIIIRKENICPKCKIEMRNLKKGGYKCRKCRSIFR
jgi:tRNA(Ile2) C34 agmatinyltransferase TiaS